MSMAVAVVVITCPVSRIDDYFELSIRRCLFLFLVYSLCYLIMLFVTVLRCDVCQRCNVTETVSCVVVM